ncbi:MAG: hypothetical protein ACI9B9_001197, partial [Halioglobus sp.]
MQLSKLLLVAATSLSVLLGACSDSSDNRAGAAPVVVAPPAPVAADEKSVFTVANGCFALGLGDAGNYISAASDTSYQLAATDAAQAAR